MQVTETLSDGLRRSFTVVVPAADIEGRKSARLTDLSKTVRLPGFRPGKVPMPIIRQRYGKAVASEVVEESVNEATRQVLTERNLRPALQPKVDLASHQDPGAAQPDTDLSFTVELELLPDITLPDFSVVTLTRLKAEPPAEEIDTALRTLAERNRTLIDLTEEELAARGENAGAAAGDILTIAFTGYIDGEAFPGGAGEDVPVDIGGAGFIPGFAEQLEGMRVNEARRINVTFPAEYGAPNLAGKAAEFEVTAKRLSRGEVPPVDDALASQVGFETLAELREMFASRAQRELDGVSRQLVKRKLLDVLADQANFDCPPSMVEQEFAQIWQRLEADRQADRLDEEDKGKDEETLRSEYRAIAERRVRLGLLLAEISRLNNLTVSQDELRMAVRTEISRYPGQEKQMLELFTKYPQLADNLRGPILEEKAVDFVLGLAQVTDQPVTPAELVAASEAAAADPGPGAKPASDAKPDAAESAAEPAGETVEHAASAPAASE